MREKNHPKIKPLIKDLEEIGIGYYLKTTAFERASIELGFEEVWDKLFERAQQERSWISLGSDHDRYDSEVAFGYLLNGLYINGNQSFSNLLCEILIRYINWDNQRKDYGNILKDLELLKVEETCIEEIKKTIEVKRGKLIELERKTDNSDESAENNTIKRNVELSNAALKEEIRQKKRDWIKLISKAELEKVIEEIHELSEKAESYTILKEVVNLSARLNRTKKKNSSGLISQESADVEFSKINSSMIDLITSLEKYID